MITYKLAKIVYFNKVKGFASETGEITGLMDEAEIYDANTPDEVIAGFFDDDYQDQIEVWKVKLTVETLVEEE